MVEHDSPLLRARRLSLQRGGRRVLTEVDLSGPRGRVTVVVGPSGAGKTSLLRCLNRLEEPDDGEVFLGDDDVRSIEPTTLRKRVGMIFQAPVIFEGGIRSNLAYGLDGLDEARMREALVAANLDGGFLERDSRALSVGQAQRVCIARALVREPEALLFDEPTSALDVDATRRIEELIVALARRDLAVVVVTHDLQQAARIADSAILLVGGAVQEAGSVHDVVAAWPSEALP